MDIIVACHTFIQACRCSCFVYNILIDKSVQLINRIGSIELNAAKECLNRARCSNNKREEISRAITIMLVARGKISSENEEKFQTTMLIAMCYYFIDEYQLSKTYLDEAIEHFNNWLDSNCPIKIFMPGGTGHFAFIIQKLYFIQKIESIGLEWRGDMSISEWRRNSISAERDLREGVKHAKEDFSSFVDNLFS